MRRLYRRRAVVWYGLPVLHLISSHLLDSFSTLPDLIPVACLDFNLNINFSFPNLNLGPQPTLPRPGNSTLGRDTGEGPAMAPNIASRIRAKLSRRRHSQTPSLASSGRGVNVGAEGPLFQSQQSHELASQPSALSSSTGLHPGHSPAGPGHLTRHAGGDGGGKGDGGGGGEEDEEEDEEYEQGDSQHETETEKREHRDNAHHEVQTETGQERLPNSPLSGPDSRHPQRPLRERPLLQEQPPPQHLPQRSPQRSPQLGNHQPSGSRANEQEQEQERRLPPPSPTSPQPSPRASPQPPSQPQPLPQSLPQPQPPPQPPLPLPPRHSSRPAAAAAASAAASAVAAAAADTHQQPPASPPSPPPPPPPRSSLRRIHEDTTSTSSAASHSQSDTSDLDDHHENAARAAAAQRPSPLTPKAPSVSFLLPATHRSQRHASNRYSDPVDISPSPPTTDDSRRPNSLHSLDYNMVTRKVWVKRPNASATVITIGHDDLVDEVRDMILRKYANSLGRTFDSPDLTIRIFPRDHQKDRPLGPEEHMGHTLDANFPGGQSVDEALIIDIPRRTPMASPRAAVLHPTHAIYLAEDGRPSEAGEGYFPPVAGVPSPRLPLTVPAPTNGTVPHSIAVLGTGHIPNIPSPGGTRSRAYRDRADRPRLGRTHTSSPNVRQNGQTSSIAAAAANHGMHHFSPRHPHSRTHSNSSDQQGKATSTSAMPNSPGSDPPKVQVATPPARISLPRSTSARPKKSKKNNIDYPNMPAGMLNGSVPPISVLIVEDNPINLRLLEAFVKRLKVRWQTAMNGKEAVRKWRTGGFHLVLMDIQLPVMNGLEATREIRRLERVNSIGVFSSSPSSIPETTSDELKEQDRLEIPSLFKSPVIIVALTASSLQSDRHEALAAGCNDFLTKPVNFVWLERKVMEWGCMQALIDFDGWRQWKDFSQQAQENEANKKSSSGKNKSKKNRSSLSSST